MKEPPATAIRRVDFEGYKAFQDFSLHLSHLNILVGPNNCGKSTILGAFRILAEALRRARAKRAVAVPSPDGLRRPGWTVPEEALPVSAENVHTNYADSDTRIVFTTDTGAKLILYFPEDGDCFFFAERFGYFVQRPGELKSFFHIDIQAVPVLGPVEHRENLVSAETVRKNLNTTRASRNFRNFWLHYPDSFDRFAQLVSRTWPGMEIKRPEMLGEIVAMFAAEERLDRELFWAGFGFQVWLQLLTHICRASEASLIVVDEPEIYLHPDVQRQLLGIVRDVGADVLMATHSTEIMAEADPTEIVLIDKTKKHARRLVDEGDIQFVLTEIGSIQNITLARLARNRRLLFVEGDTDMKLLRRFARKLGFSQLASGTDITAVESGGFSSWPEVRALASGFEKALGVKLNVGAVFDRDYWCNEELDEIRNRLDAHLTFSHIHTRKELENYLLEPVALQRALEKAVIERARRSKVDPPSEVADVTILLSEITDTMRDEIQSQVIAKRVTYFQKSSTDTATITNEAIVSFNGLWADLSTRVRLVPGKRVLAKVRDKLRERHSINLTNYRIVSEIDVEHVAADLLQLIKRLDEFRKTVAPS